MKKSWGEQIVFRGNEVGISRHLQSIWVEGGEYYGKLTAI